LFRNYAGAMYNVVFRMVGDRDEAEELVQESFIKVFEKIAQFEGRATVGSWIKRIVVNHTLNYIRKSNKHQFEPLSGTEVFEEEQERVDGLESEDIHRAIQELPSGARAIVSLHLIEGLKHREIAERLGIGESTSRSQYMRGRDLLRDSLAKRVSART
jgi:RNA polymerase sigma factor (sigma-70 family)